LRLILTVILIILTEKSRKDSYSRSST